VSSTAVGRLSDVRISPSTKNFKWWVPGGRGTTADSDSSSGLRMTTLALRRGGDKAERGRGQTFYSI